MTKLGQDLKKNNKIKQKRTATQPFFPSWGNLIQNFNDGNFFINRVRLPR